MDRKELELAEGRVKVGREIVQKIIKLQEQVDSLVFVDMVKVMSFQTGSVFEIEKKFMQAIKETYKKEALAEIKRLEQELAEL